MKWIYSKQFVLNNEILFYIFLGIMLFIILFALIMATKEIKNDNI